MIPCICIDNSNCPIDYPLPSQWIEKNKEYHIIDVKYVVKSETLGFKLLEKKSEKFFPYMFYKSDRFAFEEKYLSELLNMINNSEELREEEKVKVKRILEDGILV